MTDSELHEIENHISWGWHDDKGNDDVRLLFNEIMRLRTVAAEQDREIERLRLDGWVDLSGVVDYHRRHRKWALGEAKLQARIKRQAKDMWYRFVDRADKAEAEIADYKEGTAGMRDAIGDLRLHAEKAETELEAQLITYQAKIKEIDALETRIQDLEHMNNRSGDILARTQKRVQELEALLGEETYAERAAVRHYKRIKELEQELLWAADACEKAENLLAEKEKV